jgi:hypothetical protein
MNRNYIDLENPNPTLLEKLYKENYDKKLKKFSETGDDKLLL